jgi:hypothetical protein
MDVITCVGNLTEEKSLLFNEMEVSGWLHTPASLPPYGKSSGTYWIGGWVGPRDGVGVVGRGNLAPTGSRIPAVQPVA